MLNLNRKVFAAVVVPFLLAALLGGCAGQGGPLPAAVTPTARPVDTATPTPENVRDVAAWGDRLVFSLNGPWQAVRVASLDDAPPTDGWQDFHVPGIFDGTNYERAWFRRSFDVPATWQGQRLILHFNGVKYNSRVLVNGQEVGGHFNGYDAFELDITDAVQWGVANSLLVGVHDWTGVFSDSDLDLAGFQGSWDAFRTYPADRILSPVGGLYNYYGIWDSVSLKVLPVAHVDSIFIRPSLKNNRLDVDVTLVNSGSVPFTGTLRGRVFAWHGAGRDTSGQWQLQGDPAALFPDQPVSLGAGQTQTLTLSVDNPSLTPWTPYTPQLYVLEVGFDTLEGDALRERFGWREFTVRGGDFYLNGNRIHMLAASWWPDARDWTRESAAAQLRAIRAANVVAFRTHTQPWQDSWYEAADEVGMLMIPEGAVWNDDMSYRLGDERFWTNYGEHLAAMVHTLRNHPSVVMWSLENEFSGDRINDSTPDLELHLADLGRLVKGLDPTRPITYESDGDPGGASDVIGIHYPNEYPEHRLWPQDAYWIEQPRDLYSGGGFFWDDQPFLWDRSKPVYIGEYMWEPSGDPSTHTLFFGDRAYIGHAYYRRLGKAFAWRMQMLAYRIEGVSGHSPWTVQEEGALDESNPTWIATRDMYRPLAAFLREYDSRFFGGETVTRTVELFNDTMADQPRTEFHWALLDYDGKVQADGGETLTMASGDRLERSIQVPIPAVQARTRFTLRLGISLDGEERFREDVPVDAFPRDVNVRNGFDLYDPQGTFAAKLQQASISFNKIDDLAGWDASRVLVLAPGSLPSASSAGGVPLIGSESGAGALLAEKVRAGGRVLALEQSAQIASGDLPVTLSTQQSTLAFIQAPSHPLLAGLTDEDFRWWRGDNLVSADEPYRAAAAGVQALVVTGNATGISHAPLVEVRQGRGAWIICQLLVGTKFDSEPLARVLFGRMVDHLAAYTPPQGRVLYYPDNADRSQLQADWQALQSWDELSTPDVRLLVLFGGADVPSDQLKAYLEAGGSVLWDQPSDRINAFLQSTGSGIQVEPGAGTALRAEGESGLFDYLTREDLYWVGPPAANDGAETALANNFASMILPAAGAIPADGALPAAADVVMDGGVSAEGDHVSMYSNGSATWAVDLPEGGDYQFVLAAYGTPARGAWPLAQVQLDGTPIGTVSVGSEAARAYRVFFRAEAGAHKISVWFTNDEYDPPEDRNLALVSYLVAPSQGMGSAESLTNPPALVRVPVGSGNLFISTITWDAAGQNSQRGQRYFAGLLTGLGTTLKGGAGAVTIEAEALEPQPDAELFDLASDSVGMYTNAYIEGPVQIVRGGRYRVGISGRGTDLEGEFPLVQIALDGQVLGSLSIDSGGWELHSLLVDLPAGRHTLRLSFVNDGWNPSTGADRNVWMDYITFEPVE
jgi:hypothetical protein